MFGNNFILGIVNLCPLSVRSFDVNSVQLPDCSIIITVLDFNGGVVKDHFIGRLVLGREASGEQSI